MATNDSRGLPFASVGMNQGIVSSGDYASNQIINMGSIPAAEQVLAPHGLFQVPLGQGSVFVGREHDIRSLDTRAAGPGIMVLTGREGIGKTALARAYARRSIGRFSPVWWIEASDRGQIEESLAAIASQLEPVLAAAPVEVAARWAQSWLDCHDGWLIVLDGAPRPADLAGLLADSGHGTYVITSRQSTGWDRVGQIHELRELDPESAEQLMYALAGNVAKAEPRQVREICERLGYFPAGLEAAAAHMARTGTSPDAYLKAIEAVAAARTVEAILPGYQAAVLEVEICEINLGHGAAPELAWFPRGRAVPWGSSWSGELEPLAVAPDLGASGVARRGPGW